MVRTRRQVTECRPPRRQPSSDSQHSNSLRTKNMATNTYKPMKTMDERLLKKPKSSTIETEQPQDKHQGGSSFDIPSTSKGVQMMHGHQEKNHMVGNRTSGNDDGKLDIIIGTLASLQDSVRELHNEFAAIKPRVSQFKTSSTGSTMLVKSSVTDNPTDVYKCLVAKRKKRQEQ